MAILDQTKKYIGVSTTVAGFDEQLLTHIKSIFSSLDLIVGLQGSPTTIDETTLWPDYGNPELNNLVEEFVKLRTKIIFDPQANAIISNSLENQAERLRMLLEIMVNEIAAATP